MMKPLVPKRAPVFHFAISPLTNLTKMSAGGYAWRHLSNCISFGALRYTSRALVACTHYSQWSSEVLTSVDDSYWRAVSDLFEEKMTSKRHVICKRCWTIPPIMFAFHRFSIALTSHFAFPCKFNSFDRSTRSQKAWWGTPLHTCPPWTRISGGLQRGQTLGL